MYIGVDYFRYHPKGTSIFPMNCWPRFLVFGKRLVLLMVQKSGEKTSWGNGSLSPYLQGFIYARWLFGVSSINSRNCQVQNYWIIDRMKTRIPISWSLISVGSIAGSLVDFGQIDVERTTYWLCSFWLTKAIPNQSNGPPPTVFHTWRIIPSSY